MAEINEGPGRAHGRKGPGGYHVHGPGCGHLAFAAHDVDNLFGGDHHRLTLLNFIINFLVGFVHLVVGHNLPFSGEAIFITGYGFLGAHGAFLVTGLISGFISFDPPGNIFAHLARPARCATEGLR
jgi:hypothetical protein